MSAHRETSCRAYLLLGVAAAAATALASLSAASGSGYLLAATAIVLLSFRLPGTAITWLLAGASAGLLLLAAAWVPGGAAPDQSAVQAVLPGVASLAFVAAFVTLFKADRRALQAREQQLRRLYEEAPEAYFSLSPGYRLSSMNRTARELLGQGEAVLDEPIRRFVHDEDWERLETALRALFAGTAASAATEFRVRDAQGGWFWVGGKIVAAAEHGGAVSEARAICRDLSERKRTESALRASEEHFRNLVEGSIQGIFLHRNWKPLFANQAVADMLGYSSAEEFLALPSIEALIDPSERERLRGYRDARVKGEDAPTDYEFLARRKDGSPLVLHIQTRLVNWYGETAIQSVVVDVTDQKATQLALESNEQRFRDFAEIAADWFWETDAALQFTFLSGRVREFTAEPADRLLGRRFDALLEAEDSESARRLRRAMEQREAFDNLEVVMVGERGLQRVIRNSGRPLLAPDGTFLGYRGAGRDVTVEHRMAQKVAHQATHDSLTGLVNRLEFEQRLSRALENAKQRGNRHALCYIDLDQFKIVNDSAGHVAGDELLRALTGVLLVRIRQRDTLARLGGDEFALLLENCGLRKAVEVAETLVQAIGEFRFHWEGRSYDVGASIGVVPVTAEALNTVQLLSQADAACYTAKDLGRGRVYAPELQPSAGHDLHTEIMRATELRDALDNQRFELFCQPIFPLRPDSERHPHYELLLRMRDAGGRLVAPGAFIAAAERYGLMHGVDRWVIDNAFAHFSGSAWRDATPRISINLSANSLSDDSLVEYVRSKLEQSKLRPEFVCFEITETSAVGNLLRTAELMRALRETGFRFALDDFGSGLCSFAYLKQLPVDYLKIDGAFVRDLAENRIDRAAVAAINQVGHVMGIYTVAEFVENETILEVLREIGVDFAQGYGLCKPLPLVHPKLMPGRSAP